MSKALQISLILALSLLGLDAAVQIGLNSATTAYLYSRGQFRTVLGGSRVSPRPANFLLAQDDLSLAAGAVAFLLVSILGLVTLAFRHRSSRFWKIIYHAWLFFAVASAILALAAIVTSFVYYELTRNYVVSRDRLVEAFGRPYPYSQFTPETWFTQIAFIIRPSYAEDLAQMVYELSLYRGQRWNLVALVVLSWVVVFLGFAEAVVARRNASVRRIGPLNTGETTKMEQHHEEL